MHCLVIGLVCVWILARVLRGRRGCGPSWRGPSRWGPSWRGPSWRGWGGRGRGGRYWALRRLFERLDTTPGQEKEIRTAVDEVAEVAESLKVELRDSRGAVADALRAETLDVDTMAELMTRHDDKLDALRKAAVGALARVHETLDAEQRKRLANWIGRGPRSAGPYRSPA